MADVKAEKRSSPEQDNNGSNSPIQSTGTDADVGTVDGKSIAAERIDNMSPLDFVSPLECYYGKPDFSDIVVKCKDRDFQLHRVILCSQSAYFRTLCTTEFQDSATSIVTLEDIDGQNFDRVVSFLYTGSYVDLDDESLRLPIPPQITQVTPSETITQLQNLSGFLGAIDRSYEQNVDGFGPGYAVGYTLPNWYWDSHNVGNHSMEEYSNITAEAVKHALTTSAQMYILGERFLIPSLKILALKHFGAAVTIAEADGAGMCSQDLVPGGGLDFGFLGRLVENVYTFTMDKDLALKEPLCRLLVPCLKNGSMQDNWYLFPSTMLGYCDFTRGIMRCDELTDYQATQNPLVAKDEDKELVLHPAWPRLKDGSDLRNLLHWTCVFCNSQFCPNQKHNFSKPKCLAWMRAERAAIALKD
ncbi:hypothetical protein PspLS_07053 [Pyricularia sp. CBS 133598]|nr:hypothetical protein PspLS_07053 [Pyricularia sp. CBS 133598]